MGSIATAPQTAAQPFQRHARDLFDVKGKVFVVTGAGRGLGLTMAEGLAEAGGIGMSTSPPLALTQTSRKLTSQSPLL